MTNDANISICDSEPLSFGQYDTDALADASEAALAEFDDKSAWLNIANLA